MAEITKTKTLAQVQVLFNKLNEVIYSATEYTDPETFFAAGGMELPISSDGITFDTGQPSITKFKLTTGETWTSMSEAGDANISFQVASVAKDVNDLFLHNKVDGTATGGATTIDGKTYSGSGYSLAPKKLSGSLLLMSEDRQTVIVLLHFEGYANLVIEAGKPAYFNMQISPLANDAGAALYILERQEGA